MSQQRLLKQLVKQEGTDWGCFELPEPDTKRARTQYKPFAVDHDAPQRACKVKEEPEPEPELQPVKKRKATSAGEANAQARPKPAKTREPSVAQLQARAQAVVDAGEAGAGEADEVASLRKRLAAAKAKEGEMREELAQIKQTLAQSMQAPFSSGELAAAVCEQTQVLAEDREAMAADIEVKNHTISTLKEQVEKVRGDRRMLQKEGQRLVAENARLASELNDRIFELKDFEKIKADQTKLNDLLAESEEEVRKLRAQLAHLLLALGQQVVELRLVCLDLFEVLQLEDAVVQLGGEPRVLGDQPLAFLLEHPAVPPDLLHLLLQGGDRVILDLDVGSHRLAVFRQHLRLFADRGSQLAAGKGSLHGLGERLLDLRELLAHLALLRLGRREPLAQARHLIGLASAGFAGIDHRLRPRLQLRDARLARLRWLRPRLRVGLSRGRGLALLHRLQLRLRLRLFLDLAGTLRRVVVDRKGLVLCASPFGVRLGKLEAPPIGALLLDKLLKQSLLRHRYLRRSTLGQPLGPRQPAKIPIPTHGRV